MFQWGARVCCSDGEGASCLSCGYAPWGASVLMGVFSKIIVGSGGGGGVVPPMTAPTMGNPDDSTNFKT